ncbi:MAG TPA: DUF4389 domain-containing protein [Methanomicrobia archaeon]|nr:MAG: DUF4389 domain-containing protein [archaeon]HHN81335.1 DUF4389 domain-containing protein [Methanomicrobia archaeon]
MDRLFAYEEPASRLELFVRIVYGFLISIVLSIYGMIAGICIFLQWFVILLLGRRSKALGDFIQGYLEYQVHVLAYLNLMTDRRPSIMPGDVEIYEYVKK